MRRTSEPVEVQIRTEEMDLIAERGIAAHWLYKNTGQGMNSAQVRAQDWVRSLMDSQESAGSSLEFLENVKVDLFPDEVYLFTPRGDILSLPRNATALDYAYDWNTPGGVPGSSEIGAAMDVARLVSQIMGSGASTVQRRNASAANSGGGSSPVNASS